MTRSSSGSSSSSTPTPQPNPTGYRAVAYYANWNIYARNFSPPSIPAPHLTHLLYSFANIRPDGTVFLSDPYADSDRHTADDSWSEAGTNVYGNIKALQLLKTQNRNLKVMLSIGGWTYTNTNKNMDIPMGTEAGRRAFAQSCVGMIKDYGFDGIDVDWEYPTDTQQGSQYLSLLTEMRTQMDAYADTLVYGDQYGNEMKPKFLLSIAAPAAERNVRNLPLGRIARVVDFINLMAYDYAGAWRNTTGHTSNLYASSSNPLGTPYNTADVVTSYLSAGVPASKLILGMSLYGRAYTNTQGFGEPYNGIGLGSFEPGIYDVKDLPLAGHEEFYDEEAGASYSYHEGSGMLVSYDNVDMALRKVDYMGKRGLGGVMWWEISSDGTGEGSIVSNVSVIIDAKMVKV
ncbi:glycoside hydrolase [Decorospora gaudefroyi]|uniref:chitinase n=1 Tax=Decorospora gaudefroyi TaxID=184978 RepID=A0A6A5KVY7_9PLEO|nr:glycoside hydrolase [Decorospora gaudefroyi]